MRTMNFGPMCWSNDYPEQAMNRLKRFKKNTMVNFTHCKRRKKKKLRLILDEYDTLSFRTPEQAQQYCSAVLQRRSLMFVPMGLGKTSYYHQKLP